MAKDEKVFEKKPVLIPAEILEPIVYSFGEFLVMQKDHAEKILARGMRISQGHKKLTKAQWETTLDAFGKAN